MAPIKDGSQSTEWNATGIVQPRTVSVCINTILKSYVMYFFPFLIYSLEEAMMQYPLDQLVEDNSS